MSMSAGSVFVRIGAIFDDKGFDKFEQRHVKAQRATDIQTRLSGDFDPKSFNLYERRLDEVKAKVARRDAFKATLGGDYNPAAFRAYERDLARAERETKASHSRLSKLFSSNTAYGIAGAGAVGVLAVKSVTAAYGEAEVSQRKLQAQLKATGISYREHAEEIDNVIQKTSKMAGLDDEQLQDAFTNIIRVTGNVSQSMRLVGLAADFARAKNIDVAKAGEIVGKVASGNIGILSRYGIAIDKGASSTEALAELQKRFSGQAEAYGKTQSGAADRAKVAWENLREKLGEKLAPTFTRLANKTADFLNQMEAGTGQGGRFAEKLKKVGEALEDIGKAVVRVGGFLAEHTTLVKALAAAWVAVKVQAGLAAAAQVFGIGGGRGGVPVPVGVPGGGVTPVPAGKPSMWSRIPTAAKAGGVLGLLSGLAQTGDTPDPSGAQSKNLEAVAKQAEKLAKLGRSADIEKLAASINKFGQVKIKVDGVTELGVGYKNVAKLKDALHDLAVEAGKSLPGVGRATDKAAANFAEFRKAGANNLHGIRTATHENMFEIRKALGKDSAAGKEALAKNFRMAADAVRDAMADGKVSTREGLAEIRRLMTKELQTYGLSPQQIKDYTRSSGKGSGVDGGGGAGQGKAGGGWIVAPGMVGTDTVPTMLAPGEAVLNRHQQAVVEGYLGDGFLDGLFSRVQRPHYMARGGIVPVPGFPGEMAASSVVPEIQAIAKRFHLTLTDAYGQGHKSPGHTKFGTAADFAGSDKAMDAAVKYLVGQGYVVGYDGRFGSAAWPGHGPSYVAGGNAHLHVELGGAGGAISAAVYKALKAPRTKLQGMLGGAVQGSLNVATRGANAVLKRAANAAVSTPVAGGGSRKAPAGGGSTVGASVFGGPGDPGTGHIGYRGDDLNVFPNSFAELNMGTAMGNLPYLAALRVTGPRGSKVLRKRDIGAGGGNVQGKTRGIDLWYKAAEALGVNGLGLVKIQRLAKGGKVRGRTQPAGGSGMTTAGKTGGNATAGLSSLPKLQGPQIKSYNDWMGKAQSAQNDYSYLERRFNLTEEVFVNEDGSLNQEAIAARGSELTQLKSKLMDRAKALVMAQKIASRIVATYRTIVDRLKNARAQLSGKGSGKVKQQLSASLEKYSGDLSTWTTTLKDFDRGGQFSIEDAQLDTSELDKTVAELNGTKAVVNSTVDALSSPSADQQAIIDRQQGIIELATKNAQANATALAVFTGSGDIGMGGGNAWQAAQPNITINTLHPGDPGTLAAIASAATSGMALQNGINSSKLTVG